MWLLWLERSIIYRGCSVVSLVVLASCFARFQGAFARQDYALSWKQESCTSLAFQGKAGQVSLFKGTRLLHQNARIGLPINTNLASTRFHGNRSLAQLGLVLLFKDSTTALQKDTFICAFFITVNFLMGRSTLEI